MKHRGETLQLPFQNMIALFSLNCHVVDPDPDSVGSETLLTGLIRNNLSGTDLFDKNQKIERMHRTQEMYKLINKV